MIDVVTVGWLTVDDIVLTDGSCRQHVLGGGALYSAVGAQIFAGGVGVNSVCGGPYFDGFLRQAGARGLDTNGVTCSEGNGLELWLLHESEIHKQQIPKLSSSTAEEMDSERRPLPQVYKSAKGFHVAPQSPAGSLSNAKGLSHLPSKPIVTMDILSDVFIEARLYEDLSFLQHLTAFMPSESEIRRIWQQTDIEAWLRSNALRHKCHMVAKLGERGSVVCEAGSGRIIRVPALPVEMVDTTGAGDAYCGGFIAGLVAGRPLAECAAMGTVSASYVVEACGALATCQPDPVERETRLREVLARMIVADS
ncbi:carbohydrate kinase family protein [Mesorhizobium sp. 10J20-29]